MGTPFSLFKDPVEGDEHPISNIEETMYMSPCYDSSPVM